MGSVPPSSSEVRRPAYQKTDVYTDAEIASRWQKVDAPTFFINGQQYHCVYRHFRLDLPSGHLAEDLIRAQTSAYIIKQGLTHIYSVKYFEQYLFLPNMIDMVLTPMVAISGARVTERKQLNSNLVLPGEEI